MPRRRRPAILRLQARLAPPDENGCQIFLGALTAAGYGLIGLGGRADGVTYTHRLMYEVTIGPIPAGLHIDHLCRNRACCAPGHLEAVTQAENNRRARLAQPARTHCRRGHEFTPENTLQSSRQRVCRTCVRLRLRERQPA